MFIVVGAWTMRLRKVRPRVLKGCRSGSRFSLVIGITNYPLVGSGALGAIDGDARARDEACAVGAEKDDEVGHFLGPTGAASGHHGLDRLGRADAFVDAVEVVGHGSLDQAGVDRIDP